jgi:hypothetical protein
MFKFNDVSEVRTSIIRAMMMKAVRAFDTSVNFNVTTQHYIPEDFELHSRRCENLKSHTVKDVGGGSRGLGRIVTFASRN